MDTNNEFDELARQKLQERSFPFAEADWLAMQQVIEAQKSGRKGFAPWYLAGAALLLIGTGIVWSLQGGKGDEVASNEVTMPATSETNVGSVTSQQAAAPVVMEETVTSSSTVALNVQDGSTPKETTSTPINERVEATSKLPSSTRNETRTATTAVATAKVRPDGTQASRSAVIPTSPSTKTDTQPEEPATAIGEQSSTITSPAVTRATGIPESAVGGSTATNSSSATTAGAAEPDKPTSASSSEPELVDRPITTPSSPDPVTEPVTVDAVLDPAASTTEGTTEDEVALDAITTAPAPNDSASTAVVIPPAAPPIIDPRAPWEVSLLGGLLGSSSKYTGGESASWTNRGGREQNVGFGAEFMHMGRNIGLGTGLHYGSYSDRLRSPELDRTTYQQFNFWFLNPVDVTILVLGDSANGGYYPGTSVDTTILVIAQGTGTTSTTTRLREARDLTVRTSYLEVPLLFDAHLVQGRWSIGVRGGPSIGLLTTRRGSLPSENGEGYSDLNDLTFRKTVFGWTARAYVRYRFNAAWSVGLEPAARGQFTDNFSEGGLTRKSNAIGVMISLSYRLR